MFVVIINVALILIVIVVVSQYWYRYQHHSDHARHNTIVIVVGQYLCGQAVIVMSTHYTCLVEATDRPEKLNVASCGPVCAATGLKK